MVKNRTQKLWAVALWVERHHGSDGPQHIAEQVTRLAEDGDADGVRMWQRVAEHYDALTKRSEMLC